MACLGGEMVIGDQLPPWGRVGSSSGGDKQVAVGVAVGGGAKMACLGGEKEVGANFAWGTTSPEGG